MTSAAEHARRGIAASAVATDALATAVDKLDDISVRGPSLLPGWSRAHVVSHLARNADALVNLLIWARTGVEHPMYTSRADRDADIEEGAIRSYRLLVEDLSAACDRFARAAGTMPDSAWATGVTTWTATLKAAEVPWLRMREVWIHLVDLDAGVGFDAVPQDVVGELLDEVVKQLDGRDGTPALTVAADLPGGQRRSWRLGGDVGPAGGGAGAEDPPTVSGTATELIAWLTGRGDGSGLTGELPSLPRWA